MVNVKVSFGPGNALQKNFNDGYSIGCLRRDENIRAQLGYGSNVKFLVGGVNQPDTTALQDGDEVVVETNVGQKAA